MLVLHTEEDTILSEEIGEDILRNGMLDEAGLLKVPHHRCALQFCSKLLIEANMAVISSVYLVNIVCWLPCVRLVHASWTTRSKKLSQTPNLQTSNFCSLLTDMKAVNGKPKCMFKAQVVKVIDEVLDNTEYDGWSSTRLAEMSTVYFTTSVLNSLSRYWFLSSVTLFWPVSFLEICRLNYITLCIFFWVMILYSHVSWHQCFGGMHTLCRWWWRRSIFPHNEGIHLEGYMVLQPRRWESEK